MPDPRLASSPGSRSSPAGWRGNIVDQGLFVVENGGRTVDTQVDGIQAVDAGGVANDTLVDAGGTVLDSARLTYDTGGTFVDRGNIVAETLPTYGLTATAGGAPPPLITYGSGDVVQDGTGALVLEGSNSYFGGTMLDQGTLEIGSATGAGTGGIAFGTAHAATLRLDAAALTEGTFANTVRRSARRRRHRTSLARRMRCSTVPWPG